jgi:CRISPR/Cas system-associated protein Cas5 (RAMP superfamily)
MVEIITDEDTKKLRKATKAAKEEAKAAKIEGIKETMKKCLTESDPDLRAALERWVDGMVDAANCRFTKAVIQLFEKTISEYSDKATKLKIIEIATVNSYKDASWAINRLSGRTSFKQVTPANTTAQKQCTGVAENVTF